MAMAEGMEEGAPMMSPEEAMQMIQEMGIPPEMLAQLSMAIDVLEDAGMLPGGEMEDMAPKGNPLDSAINDATAQVMGGAPQA